MRIDSTHQFHSPTGFLVFEGVNGAGKSTLLHRLVSETARFNIELVQTREPGGTELGKRIRQLLLESSDQEPHFLTELFLFAADRAEHVARLIQPKCRSGVLVVSDRYYYSTAAFQGYGRELELDMVNQINTLAVQQTLPDLVILLDLDPQAGLKRKLNSDAAEDHDKFEEEELDFHHRLRTGFLELAQQCREPFLVVDASQPAEQVYELVAPVFENWVRACMERGN